MRAASGQRQWLFAEHLLAGRGAGDHLGRMQRMRRRQQHRLDGAIAEHGLQIVGQLKIMARAEALRGADLRLDGADDPDAIVAERSLDKGAAPSAEARDRGVDHFITVRAIRSARAPTD
jgi:hypothetical protein